MMIMIILDCFGFRTFVLMNFRAFGGLRNVRAFGGVMSFRAFGGLMSFRAFGGLMRAFKGFRFSGCFTLTCLVSPGAQVYAFAQKRH